MTTKDDHTSLQELFDDIVALIRDTPVTPELQISDADKLSMYGLYKQATVGPCDDTTAPSRFQLVARAKYQAWLDCQNMTKRQAMLEYVQLASSHDHWLGTKCREKLLEWKESSVSSDEGEMASADESVSGDSSLLPAGDDERRYRSENKTSSLESEPEPMHAQSTARFYSWLDKHFGIRPLIPRGQVDISYWDLAFAAWQCIRCSSSMSRYCQLEQQIARLWNSSSNTTTENNNNAVITGLSVRSLLDLYLRAASFPPESEIIVSPPINIPGMMQVLQHHNLNVIPVDVPQDGVVSVNVDAIQQAITDKTVAIMIVHPFGMMSTTNDDMKSLRSLVDKHELHLLEDVAECFTGLGEKCYKGSDAADVSFFSFGTIKTATALG
jgi:acyl-CoA-binding protein